MDLFTLLSQSAPVDPSAVLSLVNDDPIEVTTALTLCGYYDRREVLQALVAR